MDSLLQFIEHSVCISLPFSRLADVCSELQVGESKLTHDHILHLSFLEFPDLQEVSLVKRKGFIDGVSVWRVEMSVPEHVAVLGLRILLIIPKVKVIGPAEEDDRDAGVEVLPGRQDGMSVVSDQISMKVASQWSRGAWLRLVEDSHSIAGVNVLGTLFCHLVDSLEGEVHVGSVVEVVHWLCIINLWSSDAAAVHLAILRSWCTVQLDKDFDVVLLGPGEDLVDVWLILIWGHHLHVSESLLDSLGSMWGHILPKVNPVPIASWNSESFDAPGLHFLEVFLQNFVVEVSEYSIIFDVAEREVVNIVWLQDLRTIFGFVDAFLIASHPWLRDEPVAVVNARDELVPVWRIVDLVQSIE